MLNSPISCGSEQPSLGSAGVRIVVEGSQLLVPTRYQTLAAISSVVFGSVSDGN